MILIPRSNATWVAQNPRSDDICSKELNSGEWNTGEGRAVVMKLGASASAELLCNLQPARGDVDLGETVGVAFPGREAGEAFEVEVRVNGVPSMRSYCGFFSSCVIKIGEESSKTSGAG